MTANDVRAITKEAKGLFPSLTVEQLKLLGEIVAKYRFDHAMAILKTHRVNHDFMEFGQLSEALRGDAEKHRDRRAEFARERMVDGIRRMGLTQWGEAEWAEMTDEQVIMSHFSSLAKLIMPETDTPEIRLYLMQKTRQALVEIGVDDARAKSLAGMNGQQKRFADAAIQDQDCLPLLQALLC